MAVPTRTQVALYWIMTECDGISNSTDEGTGWVFHFWLQKSSLLHFFHLLQSYNNAFLIYILCYFYWYNENRISLFAMQCVNRTKEISSIHWSTVQLAATAWHLNRPKQKAWYSIQFSDVWVQEPKHLSNILLLSQEHQQGTGLEAG